MSIHQEATFTVGPERIYELLTNGVKFGDVTGKPGKGGGSEGAYFSLFGDWLEGRQIELVPNERIVQAWRAGGWDPGVYSIAKFELVEQGGGTKIVFDHGAFPKGNGEHLAAGWKMNYWEPLEKFLA